MPLLLLPSASNQKHLPFPEWRRGKDGDSGVCNIEDRLLQRRSPGTEFGLDWSSSACDKFGSSPAPETAKILTHICSNEEWAALAPCFSTDPVQGHSHDVEVYCWVRAGLSARSLPPTLHNLRPSANAILRCKSFSARSSTSQNCDNAEKGFRLCRTDHVEQYVWGNSFVRFACQPGYNWKTLENPLVLPILISMLLLHVTLNIT